MAAALALAEGTELHPQVVAAALDQTMALYSGAADDEAARAGGCSVCVPVTHPGRTAPHASVQLCLCDHAAAQGDRGCMRTHTTRTAPLKAWPCCPLPRAPCSSGAAVALQALAPGLSADQLPAALEFLLSRGLADGSALIREGMIAAGGSLQGCRREWQCLGLVALRPAARTAPEGGLGRRLQPDRCCLLRRALHRCCAL